MRKQNQGDLSKIIVLLSDLSNYILNSNKYMENVIVIIRREDIPIAVLIAKDLSSYRVYTFDPCMLDPIIQNGFTNAEFIEWEKCPPHYDFDVEARRLAHEIQQKLDLSVREVVPGLTIKSWQHLNFYYTVSTLLWYSSLWEDVGIHFIGKKLYIFVCDTPGEYYANSFLHSVLLMQYLHSNNIEYAAYAYPGPSDNGRLVPDLENFDLLDRHGTLLVHLPTCFYDFEYFQQEIFATGRPLIAIRSRIHDLSFSGVPTVGLIDKDLVLSNFSEVTNDTISLFCQILKKTLLELLLPYIKFLPYLDRLTDNFVRIYESQLVSYFDLSRCFEKNLPSRVILSDASMGYHDPLVSFAEKYSIPVTLLPHAKTIFDIEHTYLNITALTHPIQSHEICNGSGYVVFSQKIAYPENFSGTSITVSLRTISLLLNTLTLHGVYFSGVEPYFSGIRVLVDWCNKNDIVLKIRSRPDYLINKLLISKSGIDPRLLIENRAESLEQHAQNCDLCLMYDQPTNASLDFLRKSIPVLNPTPEMLTPSEARIENASLTPPESIESTLLKLTRFKANSLSFTSFKERQFRDYLVLFQNAQPLRCYLQ